MKKRWYTSSPGVDESFSAVGYLLHVGRSGFGRTRRPPPPPRLEVRPGEIGVTWIGHATVLIELDGVAILTDPVLSERLFVVKRKVAPGIPEGGLPPLDLVLVSHGHHDHLDVPTHRRLVTDRTVCLTAPKLSDLLAPHGYERVVEMSWGDEYRLGRVKVTALEVNHWGTRNVLPDGRGYTGFLVEGPSGSVFFPGDTAYTPLFREYGERHDVDVALLPIGAYSPPSFRQVHMNPEDALQASRDLRASVLVPIHWGTFILSYEPPEEPPRWIQELAEEAGLADRLALLEPGEARVFRTGKGESAGVSQPARPRGEAG